MKTRLIVVCLSVAVIGTSLGFLVNHFSISFDPKIEVMREVDTDNRDQSEAIELSLPIINHGVRQLEIRNIRTGCSCISVSGKDDPSGRRIDEMTVSPLGQSALRVLLRVRDRGGEMREGVAFDTNDPVNPTVEVLIKGKVFGGVKLSPLSLDFGRVAPGTKASCTVKVLDGRRPDNRSSLRLHHDNTDFSVGPLANSAAIEGNGIEVYMLPVEVRFPPHAREVSDRIAITDETGYHLCSIPVYARSGRHVEFYPSEVLLPVPGADPSARFEKRCLCVAESGTLELTAKDVPKELSVEILHLSDNRRTVIIRRSASIARSEHFHGTIVFAAKINGLEAELLELPVTILDEAVQ